MPLMLWESLPLRTTRQLGDYADSAPLPIVFGDLRSAPFPLLRLTATVYFVADHALGVTAVYVDRAEVFGWQAELATDPDNGLTWTTVRFAEPLPQTAAVSAAGIGLLDPDTGALADNPADALDRISALASRSDDWSALRAECSRAGIAVAGRIAAATSVRAAIDAVAQSIGAIWTPGMARLYPTTDVPSGVIDLHRSEVADVVVSASVDDTADSLRLAYDYSDAREKPLRFIELRASPELYGGIAVDRTSSWLRDARAAETVGRAWLSRLAGERYDVRFSTTRRSLRPGQWARLVAHPGWPLTGDDPTIMVLGIEQQGAALIVTGEYLATTPTIEVIGYSAALPDAVDAALAVEYENGVLTLTLTGELDGAPIGGALVAIDGGVPQTTDALGRAQFQVSRGRHVVAASAPGFQSFEITIEV